MGFYMRLGNYRWLFAFLTFCFPLAVYSADFYWSASYSTASGTGSTPEAAYLDRCRKMPGNVSLNLCSKPNYTLERLSDTQWLARNYINGTLFNEQHAINRMGDTCPDGGVFNGVTGKCDLPKCKALSGSPFTFTKAGQAPDAYVSVTGGIPHKAQSACYDGCIASTADQKCNVRTSGKYVCYGTGYYTGAECGTSNAPTVDTTEQATRPDPEVIEEKEPCNYTTLPDGTQTCSSLTNNEKEGQSCGTFNGVQTCVDKNPTQNKVEIDTKVEAVTTSDGKTKITKTDTATVTKCKGINDCKTETTTTKTVTVKNGQGETESTTGTCTGSACPDKDGNPDANGDGLGDCSTGDCGEGEGEEEGGGDWYEGTDDTFASVLQDFADDVADIPMVDGIGNFLTFSPGGSCPAGYVNAWVFSIELDQWCGDHIPWSLIASVVLAAAAFLAYRIAFT